VNTLKISVLSLFAALSVFGQANTLTQTSLSAALGANDKVVNVSSATGINAPNVQSGTIGSQLYIVAPGNQKGEAMPVVAVNGTAITVRRNAAGSATVFPSGSMVLAGQPNWFYGYDPSGGCTASATLVTPWVNVKTGNEWLCSSVTSSWVPGFGNDLAAAAPTAAVASAAGQVTPSGPLFHVTGTAAITGFLVPVGFQSGTICVIPDGIFTTTTANNIALASTAVVSKTDCWTYDSAAAKFYPSY
jgi:hypothetical protein